MMHNPCTIDAEKNYIYYDNTIHTVMVMKSWEPAKRTIYLQGRKNAWPI